MNLKGIFGAILYSMRVGLITPSWPGTETANGITTAVYHLVSGLRDCGCNVIILPFAQDRPSGEVPVIPVQRKRWTFTQKLRGRLERLTGRDGMAVEVQAIRIAEAVREAQRRHGLDVIVIEETQGWAGYLQRQIDIPVVITLHGPWFLHKSLQSRNTSNQDQARERREAAALRTVAGITAPSYAVLAATQAELHLAKDIPQVVVRNPIPLPSGQQAGTQDGTNGSNLLFVGRFDRHKGGDTVLAAFEILARSHESATLTFVGPDSSFYQKDGTVRDIHEALAYMCRIPDGSMAVS